MDATVIAAIISGGVAVVSPATTYAITFMYSCTGRPDNGTRPAADTMTLIHINRRRLGMPGASRSV